ncbi:MAG: lipoyl(octanoyl) transferase, partial [Pseudomonadota bacterium]|nr:lipoyl(octanoyl) transferase [Pseudomonadota bacterium]
MFASPVIVRHPGVRDYAEIFQRMQAFNQTRNADTADEIWLLQHFPVFTLGLNGKPEHVLDAGEIPLIRTDRGGQVTYHGPGQLIVYILFDVRRNQLGIRDMVTRLEQSVIDFLAAEKIESMARKDAPGVYVQGKKIAALGLRVKSGGCYHGLSLNVDMDLSPFRRINPCGHAGLEVTSLQQLGLDYSV